MRGKGEGKKNDTLISRTYDSIIVVAAVLGQIGSGAGGS